MQYENGSSTRVFLVVALCCGAATALGETEMLREDFRYRKDLRPLAESVHKVGSFEIDEEVYREVDDLKSGLRLYTGDGAEVPFIVRRKEKRTTVVRNKKIATKTEAFEKRPDGSVEIRVTRGESTPDVHEMSFETRLVNFEKQVTVHGDSGGGDWQLLTEAQPIFDYSRYLDLRNTLVTLKPNRFTRFRVIVSTIEESQQSPLVRIVKDNRDGKVFSEQEHLSFKRVDFRIESIKLINHVEEKRADGPALRAYTVTNLIVTLDEEKRHTVAVFETARAPISELTVATESVNFTRPVVVEATDSLDKDDWKRLTSGSIAKIEVGGFRRDLRRISLGGMRRFRRYRLTVRNDNSPPISIDAITAKGETREGVFFVPEGAPPGVYLGGGNPPRPKYDIAGVLAQVPFADTDGYVAEAQRENEAFDGDTRQEPINTKVFLVGAILVTVAVLGWLIARTSGSLKPEGDGEDH